MDGDRRWARARNLSPLKGHEAGADVAKRMINYFYKKGINTVTIYVMSHDNFLKRPVSEITHLFKMIYKYLSDELNNGFFDEHKVKLNFIGLWKSIGFPKLVNLIKKIIKRTKHYKKKTLNFCFNYLTDLKFFGHSAGSIISSVTQLYQESKLPNVDLLVRTGDRKRVSGFLPFKIGYTELYFSRKMWPECTSKDFYRWLLESGRRIRTFGI